jgi:hypothetical protein
MVVHRRSSASPYVSINGTSARTGSVVRVDLGGHGEGDD